MEKIYKAMGTDKRTGKSTILAFSDTNKKNFLRNCRGNGYRVNRKHCLTAESYDFVMENTNCTPRDWREYSAEEIARA